MGKRKLFKLLALVGVGLIFGLLSGWLFPCIFASGVVYCLPPVTGLTDTDKVIKGLKEDRGAIISAMDAMIDKSETEKRTFTEDEDKEYKKKEKELRSLQDRIKRLEDKQEREMQGAGKKKTKIDQDDAEQRAQEERKIFRKYLQRGFTSLNSEEREFLEQRAMTTQNGESGGYLIPQGFAQELDVALKAWGGILSAANVITTATGNTIPYPTINDTNNKGARLGENTSAGDSKEPSVGSVSVEAHTYSSKPVLVPNQLLQDSAFDLEAYLKSMLVERIGRIANEEFTTGTGTNMPKGIVTASVQGGDTAAATAITFDNLIDLFHSVDPEYRKGGVWMFNDSTLKALRKLKDSEGRPIWQEGFKDGEPGTILGKPYIINQDMADIGANAKSVVFGDLKKYLVREVENASILRLAERYAENNQTGFIMFKRLDGKLIDAGTKPIKHLLHAAS